MGWSRFKIAIVSALCALLALASVAQAKPAAKPVPGAARLAKLQEALNELTEDREGPPGIGMVLFGGGRQTFLHAGVANTKSGAAPTIVDHVRIASVAKAFSSYLAVKLAARGPGFSLDTTLGESIPGVLPEAEGVTVAELLNHTSGLAEYIRAPKFIATLEADPTAYLSPTQLTAYVKADPLEFTPGSRYHYSDTDNIAAGLIAQAATGKTYPGLLGEIAFGPLKMGASSLPKTVRMPSPYMHGYQVMVGEPTEDVSEVINPAGAWASGGIVSSPADLARFLPAYVPAVLRANRGLPRPFRPGTSQPPGPGTNSAGIGIFRYRTRCGTVYGHTGSFPGYRVLIAANAAGTRGVVFVANAQIVPGQGSNRVSDAIRAVQSQAVCLALH